MKKYLYLIFLSLVLLVWFNGSYAQIKPPTILNDPDYDFEKRLRFGFSLGVNFMDFLTTSNSDQAIASPTYFVNNSRIFPGFNVNVVTDFRIFPTFHIRFLPGLAFGHRDLDFFPKEGNPTSMKLESSFVELPLTLKYCAIRKTNIRPYLIAGTNFRIDMASYKNPELKEDVFIRLVKGDYYYEFGFGIDQFLTFFKFSTEVKFSSGFRNVMADFDKDKGTDFANAIGRIKSQVFTVSFHFE